MKVTGYLADPGPSDGLPTPTGNEPEINAYMNNKNSSVELDLWDEFVNTEDGEKFMEEIGAPRAKNLAIYAEGRHGRSHVHFCPGYRDYRRLQAAHQVREGPERTRRGWQEAPSRARPSWATCGRRSQIHPNEKMAKIYEDAYLGKYGGAEQIANVPVSTNMDAPTITGNVANNNLGYHHSSCHGQVLGYAAS